MKTAVSSDSVHTLNNWAQNALFRSTELVSELPREHPARAKAEELHLELQRVAALARRLIANVAAFPPGNSPTATPAKTGPSPAPRPALLYVDDKPARLEVLKAILEARGYQVITALNGPDGLRSFLTHKIKLAILDYYMPSMDGGAVALQMRQLRSDIPIIIFSGALTLPDRVMAAIDGFINTSEEPEVLLAKIAELVPIPQAAAS
ncbi:MAG: response regulator [Terriglobales bacterium]